MAPIGRDYRKRLNKGGYTQPLTKKTKDRVKSRGSSGSSKSSGSSGGGGGSNNNYTGGTGGGGYGAQTRRQIDQGAPKRRESSGYIPPQKARNNYTGGSGAGGYGAQTRRGIDNGSFTRHNDWRKTQRENERERTAQDRLVEAARRRVDRGYQTIGEQLPGRRNYRQHNLQDRFNKDLETSEAKWHGTSRKSGYFTAGGDLTGGRQYYVKDGKDWRKTSYEDWKKQNDHDQKEEEKFRKLAATDPKYKNDPRANWDDYSAGERMLDTVTGAISSRMHNIHYGLENNNSVNHRQMALGAPSSSIEMAGDNLKIRAAYNRGGEKAANEMREKLAKIREKEKEDRFRNKLKELNAIDKKASAGEAKMQMAQHGTKGLAKFGLETLGAATGMAVDIGIGAALGGVGAIPSMVVGAAGSSARYTDKDEYGRSKTMQALRSGGVDAAEKQMEMNKRYAAVSGAIEGLSEKIFAIGAPMQKAVGKGLISFAEKDVARGIRGTGDAFIRNLAKKLSKGEAGQNLITSLGKAGISMTGEGLEEVIAGVLNPVAEQMLTNKDEKLDWGQVLSDSWHDAMIGGAIGGLFGGAEVYNQARQGKFIRDKVSDEDLIKMGKRSGENTISHRIANQLEAEMDQGVEMNDFDAVELNAAINKDIEDEYREFDAAEKKADREMAEEFGSVEVEDYKRYPIKNLYEYRKERREDEQRLGTDMDSFENELDEETPDGNLETVKHYEDTVDKATATMQEKLQGAFMENQEEGEEESGELPELNEENRKTVQAIANLSVGEASLNDMSLFSEADPIARETLQETLGVELPAGNEATRKALLDLNAENRRSAIELSINDNVVNQVRAQLGAEGYKDFKSAVKSHGIGSDHYATAYDVYKYMYDAGLKGSLPYDKVPVPSFAKGVLPEDFMRSAYVAGRRAAGHEKAAEGEKKSTQERNEKSVRKAKTKKKGRFENKVSEEYKSNLDEKERARVDDIAEVLKVLADTWKVNIQLVDGDNYFSGNYQNGVITVAANMDDPVFETFVHEFMHHMEKLAPKEWKSYADFVARKMDENDPGSFERAVDHRMQLYNRDEDLLKTREDARREVIADSTRALFRDKDFPKELTRHDASLAAKIGRIIKDMLAKIKERLGMTFSRQQAEFKALWKDIDALQELSDRFMAAAEAQLENETSAQGGTQYMLTIIGGKGVTEPSIREQIESAKTELDELPVIPFESVDTSAMSPDDYIKAVHESWKKYGSYIDTLNYGKVELDNAGLVRDGFNHIEHDLESQGAFPVVPKVIKRGIQIALVKNHDGRGYDTLTIGARVGSEDAPKYMAVVLRKTKGTRYYMHSIKTPNGEAKEDSSQEKNKRGISSGSIRNADGDPSTTLASNNKVSRFSKKSKRQMSLRERDEEYMKAVESGDMETAQRMVDEAAKAADYDRLQYHQTASVFTVFDLNRNNNSASESLFPYGIFTKSNSRDIGIEGDIQMPLYVRAHNILRASSREDMKRKMPAEYKRFEQALEEIDKYYESLIEEKEDKYFETMEDFLDRNPDIYERWRNTSYEEGQEMLKDFDDEAFQKAKKDYDDTFAEWRNKENAVSKEARQFVTEWLKNNGYDGFEVSLDAGSFGRTTDTLVLFDRSQAKSADPVTYDDNGNVIPLSERFNPESDDVRYKVKEDSEGNELSQGQQEYFKDSKIRDDKGRLMVMYHGTANEFTVFDFSQGGINGTAEGFGIYLADTPEISDKYGGRIIKGYVNITRPAYFNKRDLTEEELANLIKVTAYKEAEEMAEDYDGDIEEAVKDTWISNYSNTYEQNIDDSCAEVAASIIRLNNNDMDIVQEIMNGMGIRDYPEAIEFYDILTEQTGIDGFVTEWDNSELGEKHKIVLAFRSNQVKETDNQNPTKDPDIQYSIIDDYTDNQGRYYEQIVLTDSKIFEGKKYKEREKALHEFVYNKLAGVGTYVYDDDGNAQYIEFAKENERVKKAGAKNSHKVLEKLARKKGIVSQFAVAHATELIEVSRPDEGNEHNEENNHQWLDENGWNYRKAYILTTDGKILEVTLNIGVARDGRKILYDINKINTVGDGVVPHNLGAAKTSNGEEIISREDEKDNGEKTKKQHSLREFLYDAVSLSPERVDSLIREYAQPGNTKGNYSQAWIATIDPRDFLKLTVEDETLAKWQPGTKNAWGQEVRELNKEDLKNEIQMPYLRIDSSESHSVIGHEGRHRMLALMRAGYTNIPVVIIDTSNKETKEKMDSMDLWAQDFGKGAINNDADIDVFDVIPINEKHRFEIEDIYVDNTTVQFQLRESIEDYEEENERLREKIDKLRSEMKLSHGTILADKDAARIARDLLDMPSYVGGKKLNTLVKELKEIYADMAKDETMDDGILKVMDLARDFVNHSAEYDEESEMELKSLNHYLRTTPLYVPEKGRNDIVPGGKTEWNMWRKKNFGKIKLVGKNYPGAKEVDQYLSELNELFPGIYNETYGSWNSYDNFRAVIEYRDSLEANIYTPYSADHPDYGKGMVDSVAAIIFEHLDSVVPGKNFADRKKAEKAAAVQKTKDKYNKKISKLTDKKNAEKRAAVEKTKEHYQELLKKIREEKNLSTEEKLRRRMEKEQERDAKRRERATRRKLRSSIERDAKQLSDMLLKPTDNKHLPKGYDSAVAALLNGLDFETIYTDKWIQKHGQPSERVMNLRDLREQYAKIMQNETAGIEADDYMMMLIEALSYKVDGKRLADLNTKTLKEVQTVVHAIRHQIASINRTFSEGIKQTISEIGNETIAYMNDLDDQKVSGGAVGRVRDFINVSNAKPVDFFDRLGSPLQTVFQEIVKGEDAHINNIKQSIEYIEDIKKMVGGKNPFEKWSGTKAEAKEFELSNGESIELTPAQVMSLYALNKREQARRHIFASGVVVAPVSRNMKNKVKKKLLGDQLMKTHVRVTYEDVVKIVASMTEEQKAVADKFLSFLNNECAAWGNETSMKLNGYEKFREKNYFPIKSSDMFLNESTQEKQNAVSKLKNTGFTKAVTEFADNPIVIDDFFRVCTGHINTMSMYNAFVPAITDFERVYNYNDRSGRGIESSVKQSINRKFGDAVNKYITTLLQDLNTQYNRDQNGLTIADELLRRWKSVKIGANARVLVQQPTAITRAQVYIDYKYLSKSLAKNANPAAASRTKKRMWDTAPIAYWKHLGFAQTDVSRDMNDILMGNRDSKWNEFAFGMYGFADDVTWTRIFGAVEEETRAEHPEIEEGSKEWKDHVNERFRYIVDRTQVVDSTLHRSQMMRSKDWYMRSITSFMAEPTTQVNMWLTMLKTARDQIKDGDGKAAAKTITRFGQNYIISMVTLSVAASLISAMRESWTGDDDDDERMKDMSFVEKWLKIYAFDDFTTNINLANQLPWVKDIISLFEGYDVQRADLSMIADAIQSAKKFKEYFDKDGDVKYSWKKLAADAAADGAALFGIPVSNVERDITAARKMYFNAMKDADYAHFKTDSLELNPQKNKGKFIDYYLNELEKGNKDTAEEMRKFLKDNKITQDDIDKTVSRRLNEEVGKAIDEKKPEKMKNIIKKYKKNYDYSGDDVSKKVRAYFNDELKEAIEKGDLDKMDKVVSEQKKYGMSNDEIDSSVAYWTNRFYKSAVENGDTDKMDSYDTILKRSGMKRKDIYMNRGNMYIGYYDMLIYNAGSSKERHRLARKVASMYPDMTGENYILDFVGNTKSKQNISNWRQRKWTKAQIGTLRYRD